MFIADEILDLPEAAEPDTEGLQDGAIVMQGRC